MTNIAYAELCELRPFFSTAFQHLKAMRPPGVAAAAAQQATDSQPWTDSFDYSAPARRRGTEDARSQSGFDIGSSDYGGGGSSRARRGNGGAGAGSSFQGQSMDDSMGMSLDESMRSESYADPGGGGGVDDEDLSVAAWAAR